MIALPFRITLLEPLLATSLEGDPNSATSYPFIPGSLIRGALATRYLKQNKVDAMDEAARRLFFDGTTRYLHAYPLDREDLRTLPTPFSWMVEKGSEPPTKIYDWSCEREDCDLEQPKTLDKPFCRLVDETVELYGPLKQVNIHTQRDRLKGRSATDSGAIFRYEGLAPGQDFGAVILFDCESDVDYVRPLLLSEPLLLGGSQSAGYGHVSVEVDEPRNDWSEIGRAPVDIAAGESFALTLLSDALVRDDKGQYATTLTEAMITSWPDVSGVEIADSFKQDSVIGGFNRKWGLPLPQTPVIRAGSVFVATATEVISSQAVAVLESQGIGHRRVEGFGRIAINWHGEEEELQLMDNIGPERLSQPVVTLSGDGLELAEQMVGRLLWRRIEGRLAAYVNQLKLVTTGISPSQLARLRVVIQNAQTVDDMRRIRDWLDNLKPTARRQFKSARIRNVRLSDWLKDRTTNPEDSWTQIGMRSDDMRAIGSVKAEWTDSLAREVTTRLIDAVLAKMGKEAKRNE